MGDPVNGNDGEIRREFEVVFPDGATPEQEERLIKEAEDREVERGASRCVEERLDEMVKGFGKRA